jgi:hypothetical protein
MSQLVMWRTNELTSSFFVIWATPSDSKSGLDLSGTGQFVTWAKSDINCSILIKLLKLSSSKVFILPYQMPVQYLHSAESTTSSYMTSSQLDMKQGRCSCTRTHARYTWHKTTPVNQQVYSYAYFRIYPEPIFTLLTSSTKEISVD